MYFSIKPHNFCNFACFEYEITDKTFDFMNDKKVLFVSSEVVPYLPENEVSKMSFETPRMVNDRGGQIRIFMPRFGSINERRHQLHEVIRLSGMNLVINDMDMPLIIKVASIPKERIQVYFIDNEEYFKRKGTFTDKQGDLFSDNDERAIFFAKGVVETVKKLNWTPDIIHVQGWMASLLPLYLKKYYHDEPLFADSKIVMSVFKDEFEGSLNPTMKDKVAFDGFSSDDIAALEMPDYKGLLQTAMNNADGVVVASKDISKELQAHIDTLSVPVLPFVDIYEFEDAYTQFYTDKILK